MGRLPSTSGPSPRPPPEMPVQQPERPQGVIEERQVSREGPGVPVPFCRRQSSAKTILDAMPQPFPRRQVKQAAAPQTHAPVAVAFQLAIHAGGERPDARITLPFAPQL